MKMMNLLLNPTIGSTIVGIIEIYIAVGYLIKDEIPFAIVWVCYAIACFALAWVGYKVI